MFVFIGGFMMFKLKEHGTNTKTEILAGLTTFLTMVYIVVVNPIILSDAGVPFDQVFLATIISAVIGTLWMALLANYPIAIAPGMGLNAYFTYSVVGANENITYAVAFSAVFVAGIIFILLSLTPLRKKLIEAIPQNLKHGITAGIGLFIAFIGLRLTGLIQSHPTNLVQLGDPPFHFSHTSLNWFSGYPYLNGPKCTWGIIYRNDRNGDDCLFNWRPLI